MELKDKNGLTEKEFLAQYKQKDYPRPSLTVDVAIFSENPDDDSTSMRDSLNSISSKLELLLIKRGGHPFLGCWALPGGFVNEGEDADTAAARELEEETGLKGIPMEQLGVYSAPGRDPRAWTVSSAYVARIDKKLEAKAGDDAADAVWFSISVKRRQEILELTATSGDSILKSSFEVVPQPFSTPRARVVESDGFAFDHAQIVADAYLRATSKF
ncbi:MAG: NUDIX domain-containing protein [Coriobacteriales bacterium]